MEHLLKLGLKYVKYVGYFMRLVGGWFYDQSLCFYLINKYCKNES